MVIKTRRESDMVEIDLSGPEGNAWNLLGVAQKFAQQTGVDPKPILDDMKSADYDHLIEVFDKHFGEFVTLYR